MKLLTKEILNAFKKQGDTSRKKPEDIKVICKFFNPCGAGTWYATEYDEQEKIFLGFVSIHGEPFDEFGSFSLTELESLQLPWGLHIERDKFFDIGSYNLKQIYDGARP